MFHCISRSKIPYNALQIYLIFYALLFLSVTASRMADGISRIIDSIWLASIFRSAVRQHTGKTRIAANLITFDRRHKLSSPLRKFNVPETRRSACEKRETTRTMYSARYVAMNFLAPKCEMLQRFLTNRLKRNGLHRRESLFDEVESRNAA